MLGRLRARLAAALGRDILPDFSALLTASWLRQGLALLTSVLLARAVGTDGYGQITIGIVLVSTITQFLDIRTQEGNVRFVTEALARDDRARAGAFFSVALGLDVLLMLATVGLLWLAVPAAAQVYDDPALVRSLARIYTLTVPFTTLETSFASLLIVFRRLKAYSVGSILTQSVLLAGVVLLRGEGVQVVMWAYVAAAAVGFAYWVAAGLHAQRGEFPLLRLEGTRAALREFLPFAFHTSLTESLKTIFTNVDVLVLGALRPAGDVGLYRVAMSATSLSALFVTPLRTILYPELTEAWVRRELARIRRILATWTLYGTLISLGMLLGFLLVAPLLLRWLYGPAFVPAAPLITLLMLGYLFSNAFLWLRPLTLSAGRPGLLTYVTLLTSILRAGLAIPLIAAFGARGAAYAFVSTMAIYGLVAAFYALPKLGVWGRRALPDAADG